MPANKPLPPFLRSAGFPSQQVAGPSRSVVRINAAEFAWARDELTVLAVRFYGAKEELTDGSYTYPKLIRGDVIRS